jgi:hypothetical protein
MQNKINKILFKTLLVIIPLTALTYGYSYSVHALANTIYNQTAAQFLR